MIDVSRPLVGRSVGVLLLLHLFLLRLLLPAWLPALPLVVVGGRMSGRTVCLCSTTKARHNYNN